MGAIKVHHTETSDKAWDGPDNEARLRKDESEAYYRKAYAWQDPEKDPETKGAYKFPHHFVDGDGNIGAASVKACQSIIAILNGGMGGAKIPEEDRKGVWRHAAAHLEDADLEPAELRQLSGSIEQRSYPMHEVRVDEKDGKPRMVGYAAVFDQLSDQLWGFRERIRRGAFAKTLQEADVRALWNHDRNYVLGRTKSGTLRLWEDDHGLGVEIFPPDAVWARDLLASMERGDVDQMSFSFEAVRENWSTEDNTPVREVVEAKLYDVSPVTFPAYPQTNISVRSAFGMAADEFVGAFHRLEAGAMTESDVEKLTSILEAVQSRLTAAPAEGGHPAESGEDGALRRELARIRLELVKRKTN